MDLNTLICLKISIPSPYTGEAKTYHIDYDLFKFKIAKKHNLKYVYGKA